MNDEAWKTGAPERPHVALITNHGYAGARIPVGGAPDTGGQNFYVNQLARSLGRLGYLVTIFARGGFPFFGSDRMREGVEFLSEDVRYVFVPGGGDQFLRKEDIAIALDEEAEWLADFVRREADARGCEPWEAYELVNTHYWDGAVLGVKLVESWRDDIAADAIAGVLEGAVPEALVEGLRRDRHWLLLGADPAHHLGDTLVAQLGGGAAPADLAARAVRAWAERRGVSLPDGLLDRVRERGAAAAKDRSPFLVPLAVRALAGEAVLEAAGEGTRLAGALRAANRHVWTPHSLGDLKDLNFRDKPDGQRRALKFCERRSHERMVCAHTPAFAPTSGDIAEHLATRFGVELESMFYFPPCVDGSLFRRYADDEREPTYRYLSEASGVPVERLRAAKIVFETSRQDVTKRKDVLLRAFAQAARDVPDAYLFIGGGPENEVFVRNLALRDADPVLRERAFLLGFVPDEALYPLFSIADVFVTPSEMEGFGMSASQAAAAATALVSSDRVPFATLYVPDSAVIAPAGDVGAFADAIRALLTDDADRRRRAERLAEAARSLDWDSLSRAFLAHLRRRGLAVREPGRAG